MNSSNIYFLSMTTRVVYLCVNNQLVVLTIPAFNGFITQLMLRKDICDGYMAILQGGTTGITLEGVSLKKEISLNFGVASFAVSAYGASIKDKTLQSVRMFSFNQLLRTKPEELKISLTNILKIIDTNKLALIPFGITPAFIITLTALQTSLNDSIFGSKNAIDVHKTTLELLDEELNQMQLMYTDMIDPLADVFKLTALPFYKLYKAARKVPHHHIHDTTPVPPDPTTGTLALAALNNVTGLAMSGVNFSVLSINYAALTDANGEITNTTMLPGEYSGTLTYDNFTTIDFTFTIRLGEITELGFLMVPVAA